MGKVIIPGLLFIISIGIVVASQDRTRQLEVIDGAVQGQMLRVYDATGAVVGPVRGTNGNVAIVSFSAQSLLFNLQFGRMTATGTTSLYFLSHDCSGPAFMEQDQTHIFPDTYVLDTTVYVEDLNTAPQNLTMYSAADPAGCFVFQSGRATTALPTVAIGGLLNRFVPPFHAK